MEFKARIDQEDVRVGLNNIDIHLSLPICEGFEKYIGKDLRVEIKQYREKRSLNSNAYFYVLVEKIANALGASKPFIHNLMLKKYGQVQRIDGRPVWVVLPETKEVQDKVDNDEFLHLRATSEVKTGKDNGMYRTYVLLKGSHELDTKEMSILLQGTVDEAKELGIQTATPQELKEMAERWGV